MTSRSSKPFLPALVVVAAALVVAAVQWLAGPGADAWYAVHVLTAAGSAVSFALAAWAGVAYIRTDWRLRAKDPALARRRGPSLEGLDGFARHVLPIGLGLLTAAIASGFCNALQSSHAGWFRIWQTRPKMVTAFGAWLICAVAMQVAYAKRFRGRQVAAMSILVFLLVIAVLLASVAVPAEAGAE